MYIRNVIVLIVMILLSACSSSLLPSEKRIGDSKYSGFNDVKQRYDMVSVDQTTVADLVSIGFDPFNSQNVEILNYTDVIGKFMPNNNIKKEDLPEGVSACISAREKCFPFTMHFEKMNTDRIGNAAADIFGFVREKETRGWTFGAMFIVIDGVVRYKLYQGEPHHYQYKKEKKPLGPLQSVGDAVIKNTI